MKKINGIILIVCYVVSMFVVFPMIILNNYPERYFSSLLIIAFILALTGIVISVVEIIRSEKIKGTEKFLWILAIVMVYTIGQPLYILSGRKNI